MTAKQVIPYTDAEIVVCRTSVDCDASHKLARYVKNKYYLNVTDFEEGLKKLEE